MRREGRGTGGVGRRAGSGGSLGSRGASKWVTSSKSLPQDCPLSSSTEGGREVDEISKECLGTTAAGSPQNKQSCSHIVVGDGRSSMMLMAGQGKSKHRGLSPCTVAPINTQNYTEFNMARCPPLEIPFLLTGKLPTLRMD